MSYAREEPADLADLHASPALSPSASLMAAACCDPPGVWGEVLDALDIGIIAADAAGQVRIANRAAQRRMADGGMLALQGAMLRMRDPKHQPRLDRALAAAAAGRRSLLLERTGGWTESAGFVPVRALVLVILGGTGRPSPLGLEFYALAHGLTPAESRVLAALASGTRPGDQASMSGVSISTIRSQIAAVREKTQTASLVGLVRLVASLPPMSAGGWSAPAHDRAGPRPTATSLRA